jgi:peptidoglycan hydrolase CwlO-like protein
MKKLLLLWLLFFFTPVAANAAVEETLPNDDLLQELAQLRDLQDGMLLTLAACVDEPHCITALNEQEINQMQEELQQLELRLEQLDANNAEQAGLLDRFTQLKAGHNELQQEFISITTHIDRNSLEGNWADRFVFDDFVIGPTVPFPNEHILLSRFEDLSQPLPIE